jgi:integrase
MSVFTSTQLEAIKPQEKPVEIVLEKYGRGKGSLILRILPDGNKVFHLRHFENGTKRFPLIGYFDTKGQHTWRGVRGDHLTLAAGKAGGRALVDIVTEFGDIEAYETKVREDEREQELERIKREEVGSFDQLLETYLAHLESENRASAKEVRSTINLHVRKAFPELLNVKANQILPRDIQMILAKLVRAGSTRQVNKLRSYLHTGYAYGAKYDNDPRRFALNEVLFDLQSNPVSLIGRIAAFDKACDRALSEKELCLYWKELETLPLVLAIFLRVQLALGGQRIRQLLSADWDDFNFEKGILKLTDGKGRSNIAPRSHLLPISPWVQELMLPLKQLHGDKKFPFCGGRRSITPARTHPSSLSNAVTDISKVLVERESIESFSARDIRRTCETLLASLQVSKEVRAHLLSHGRTTGVQNRHYDQWEYLPEKTEALETWQNFLRKIFEKEG